MEMQLRMHGKFFFFASNRNADADASFAVIK